MLKIEEKSDNPFDVVKEVTTQIHEYEVTGKTKEETKEKVNKMFEELEKKYGIGLVRNVPHIFAYVKDNSGNIVNWVYKGKFVCSIPIEHNHNKEEKLK